MRPQKALLVGAWAFFALAAAHCGSSSSSPTASPTPAGVKVPTPVPSPTVAPSPTPSSLPAGMVCDPTPPPILRMNVSVHSQEPGRIVLDSKPLVANIDHYCDKWFGDWKFCETRPEGDPQRQACDYLVVGHAEDTGRWGPTWFFGPDLCSDFPGDCSNHQTEQFLVVAKSSGTYEACAAEGWPIAPNGGRCGTMDVTVP